MNGFSVFISLYFWEEKSRFRKCFLHPGSGKAEAEARPGLEFAGRTLGRSVTLSHFLHSSSEPPTTEPCRNPITLNFWRANYLLCGFLLSFLFNSSDVGLYLCLLMPPWGWKKKQLEIKFKSVYFASCWVLAVWRSWKSFVKINVRALYTIDFLLPMRSLFPFPIHHE